MTSPPPSMTTTCEVLTTFAVAVIAIVTGSGPQSKVITPPRSTASTTAADVQPAGLPEPITMSGRDVSTGRVDEGGGGASSRPGRPVVGSGVRRTAGAAAEAAPSICGRAAAVVRPPLAANTSPSSANHPMERVLRRIVTIATV